MKKFEFIDYKTDVEIAGNTFKMDVSTETGDYIKTLASDMRDMASDLADGKKSKEEATNLCASAIDHLLGEGSVSKIFTSRKKNFDDLIDILMWLMEIVNEFSAKRRKILDMKGK